MFILDDQNEALHLFDQKISNSKITEQHYQNYHAVYDDLGIEKAIVFDLIKTWTEKSKDERLAVAQSWSRGALIDQPYGLALRALIATRKLRWQRLAQDLVIPVPTHFQLYRAVEAKKRDWHSQSDSFQTIQQEIREVVRLWQSNPDHSILALQRNGLSSWSLYSSGTRYFRENSVIGLLYKAIVPFTNTIADKWIDDSNFLAFSREHEVVVSGDIEAKVMDIEVILWGQAYTISDLGILKAAWVKTAKLGNLSDA